MLFRASLTAQLLMDVTRCALQALSAACRGDGGQAAAPELPVSQALALLEALPGVPRFGMAVMCLARREREGLATAWDDVAVAASSPDAARLAAIRSAFRV